MSIVPDSNTLENIENRRNAKLSPQAAEQQAAILHHVGVVITSWSNVESVLVLMLEALLGTTQKNAFIIYYSLQSSRVKEQLIGDLARANLEPSMLTRLEKIFKRMKTLRKERNALAHSEFVTDPHTHMFSEMIWSDMQSYDGGAPEKRTQIDHQWLNRAKNLVPQILEINKDLWDLCRDLHGYEPKPQA